MCFCRFRRENFKDKVEISDLNVGIKYKTRFIRKRKYIKEERQKGNEKKGRKEKGSVKFR